MPFYSFLNKITNEETEELMTEEEKETFLKDNSHITQIFTKISIGDSVRLGVTKPPPEFMKGIIGRMQETIPQNRLKTMGKFQIPREI